jgi:hypothetical protein
MYQLQTTFSIDRKWEFNSLTPREEYMLRLSENVDLGRICGHMWV